MPVVPGWFPSFPDVVLDPCWPLGPPNGAGTGQRPGCPVTADWLRRSHLRCGAVWHCWRRCRRWLRRFAAGGRGSRGRWGSAPGAASRARTPDVLAVHDEMTEFVGAVETGSGGARRRTLRLV